MRTMKHFPLRLASAVAALALVATPVFGSPFSHYAGIYSSEAPDTTDASGPAGPAVSVSLGPGGTASVPREWGKGRITWLAPWPDAEGQITIKCDAVGDKPADAPMVFQPSHDGLQ